MFKYIFTTDFKSMAYKKSIIIIWLFSVIIYPIFLKIALNYDFISSNVNDIFLSNIGCFGKIKSLVECSMLLLNVSFYCYIAVYIYTLNVELGKEILYLRMPYKKWLIIKIFSITLTISLFSLAEVFLLTFTYSLLGMNIDIPTILCIAFNGVISKLILAFFCLVFFQINYKFFIMLIMIIYTMVGIFSNNNIVFQIAKILFASNYIGIEVVYLILLIVILYFISMKKMYIFFGRK